jgi:CRP-like cAMP-binding protein
MNTTPPRLDDLRDNQLLSALDQVDLQRWQPHLEPVHLALGQVLGESGHAPTFVYFPTTAIVSLQSVTEDGASSEIAVVGNDGIVGLSLFMGGNAMPSEAVVQSAGQGYRMRAQVFKTEVNRAGPILMLLMRYTQALMNQVAQTAACNRYHTIDQLVCRRLLMGLERLPANALLMTQELLATLLGVRREGVTAAALKLQREGVIRYSRGRIDVLDRKSLAQRTGECLPARVGPAF